MNRYTALDIPGYEEVVRCDNSEVGFTAWIAIHNSFRGPALGGCRVWSYPKEQEGLTDVLRLSKGMTYKNALARLPLGGGKSVVHADLDLVDRKALFTELGKFVEHLDGRYITAEDVNSTLEDMAVVKEQTRHVVTVGASGNPSPFTAYGVYCAIRASVRHQLRRERLDGLTVAIQGVGETGGRLAELLKNDNCRLVVSDINPRNVSKLREKIDVEEVMPEAIYDIGCDIFSPCALGGILNSKTIPRLLCQIVAGSANNQLLNEEDGWYLHKRGILYAPDYAANAGGVINISCEIGCTYNRQKAMRLTARIEKTLQDIYNLSKEQNQPTSLVANTIAEKLFSSKAMVM